VSALALADWLDSTYEQIHRDHLWVWRSAIDATEEGIERHLNTSPIFGPAMRVARAVLREPDPGGEAAREAPPNDLPEQL
jgi:hypothetical protein